MPKGILFRYEPSKVLWLAVGCSKVIHLEVSRRSVELLKFIAQQSGEKENLQKFMMSMREMPVT